MAGVLIFQIQEIDNMTKLLPALMIGLIALAAAFADGKGDFKASSDLPHAVVDTHELMEIFNESLYKDLQEKMAKAPENAGDWKLLKRQGYRAAEVANLVAMRNPEGKHAKLWRELTAQAQKAGVELADAAGKEDWAAAQTAYKGIITNCNACHQQVDPDHAPMIMP